MNHRNKIETKNIVWLVRGFKDYRLPIYHNLGSYKNTNLFVLYNKQITPNSVQEKLDLSLINCIGLDNEITIGPKTDNDSFANRSLRIPIQKGVLNKLKKIEPYAIIGEGFFQWTIYAVLYKLFFKTKLIISYERTAHTERNAQNIRKLYRKLILRFIDGIVCNGILSEKYILSLGYKGPIYKGNMTVDVEAINKKYKTIKKSDTIETDKIRYLYLGTLSERKGISQLLEVWKEFEKNNTSKIELQIVGNGPLKNTLSKFIKDHHIKTAEIYDAVSYEKIINLFISSDVLINPTLEDNWSLVVPEAMSAELPIITTKYNGLHPELITEKNGWLIDILDYSNTLFTLKKTLKFDKKQLKEMGYESFSIIQKYKPELIAKNYYNSIFNEN